MREDLPFMLALAQSHAATGKPPKYLPGLELAYARTIAYLVENWQPKEKFIKLKSADAEVRIKE